MRSVGETLRPLRILFDFLNFSVPVSPQFWLSLEILFLLPHLKTISISLLFAFSHRLTNVFIHIFFKVLELKWLFLSPWFCSSYMIVILGVDTWSFLFCSSVSVAFLGS